MDGQKKHSSNNHQLRASEQQLKAAIQQLRASEQQFKVANQQLEASNQQLRASEKQLGEEREKAQKYLDVAGTMMVVVDPNQKVTLINKKGCEILGYKEEEILGQKWFDNFLPESARKEAKAVFQQLMAGEVELVEYHEGLVLTKSGEKRIIAWHNAVLTDEDDNIIDALISGADVTEHKKAEEALRDSEALYVSLVENLQQYIYRKDLEGKFTFGNKGFCETLGKPPGEIIGKTDFDFYPAELAEKYLRNDQKVIKTEEILDEVEEHHLPDGKKIYVQVVKTPLYDSARKIIGTQGIFWDITERKRAEEALRAANQQLQASEQQFRAANQQLQASEQQLRSANQQLQASEQQLRSANQQLRASEKQLGEEREKAQKYLDVAGTMMVVVDPNQKVTLINKKGCEILGYKEEEILGQNWFDNFLPESACKEAKTVFQQLMAGEVELVEYHEGLVLTKSGEKRIIAWHNAVLTDEDGNVVDALISGADVTERKKAEEALRDSEALYVSLVENLQQYIYRKDLEGRFTFGNKGFCETLGKPLDEIIGKTDFDFYPAELAEKYRRNDQKVIKTEEILDEIEEHHLPDGKKIYVQVVKTPLYDSARKIIGTQGIFWDITERKQAEEALRAANQQLQAGDQQLKTANQQLQASGQQLRAANQQLEAGNRQLRASERQLRSSEEKYRSIFETAPNLIISVNKEGITVDCNHRIEQILGYMPDEVIGQNVAKIIHPESLPKAQKFLREIFTKGFKYNQEYKMIRKDGIAIDVSVNSAALTDEKGERIRTTCIVSDVTERKRAEEKLLDYQAQLKSLASQLSLTEEQERHRIATELHATIGQSLVISKIKLDALRVSAPSGDLAKTLEEVCNSLDQTIQETRSLTFDLSSPILYELGFETAVAEWLTERIQLKHGIATEFEDDGQLKPLDDDIRALLFRDVRELLINVVKHAQAEKVKVSICKVGSQIRISVEDDGWGFDPAKVAARAARAGGFGLFSIRERLEQLGGHLEVESKPGHGSRVTIMAPLKRGEITDRGQE